MAEEGTFELDELLVGRREVCDGGIRGSVEARNIVLGTAQGSIISGIRIR